MTWTQLVVTGFTAYDHIETARGTIQGVPDFSPDASPLAVFFDDPDQDGAATPVTVNEPDRTVDRAAPPQRRQLARLDRQPGRRRVNDGPIGDYSFPQRSRSRLESTRSPSQSRSTTTMRSRRTSCSVVEITGVAAVPTSANVIVGQPRRVRSPSTARTSTLTPPSDHRAVTRSWPQPTTVGSTSSRSSSASPSPAWGLDDRQRRAPPEPRSARRCRRSRRRWRIPVNVAAIGTDGAAGCSGSGVTDSVGNAFTGTRKPRDAANPVLTSVHTQLPASRRREWQGQTGDLLTFNFSEPWTLGRSGSTRARSTRAQTTPGGSPVPGVLLDASTTGGNYNGSRQGQQRSTVSTSRYWSRSGNPGESRESVVKARRQRAVP